MSWASDAWRSRLRLWWERTTERLKKRLWVCVVVAFFAGQVKDYLQGAINDFLIKHSGVMVDFVRSCLVALSPLAFAALVLALCVAGIALHSYIAVSREARQLPATDPPKPENEWQRLADSLTLKRETICVRLDRRYLSHNPGESVHIDPKTGLQWIRNNQAVEIHTLLRKAIRKILLDYEEGHGVDLKSDRKTYFQAIAATAIGQDAMEQHIRVLGELIKARRVEDFKAPIAELREWEEKYERFLRLWEVEP